MLHHIDKSNLEDYMLDEIFDTYDDYDSNAVTINQGFAPKVPEASIFRSQIEIVDALKNSFKKRYLV